MPELGSYARYSTLFLLAWLSFGLNQSLAASASFSELYSTHIADQSDEQGTTKKDFSLLGELGVRYTQGNADTSSIKTSLSATHELPNWRNQYELDVLLRQQQADNDGVNETETTAQRLYLSAQMDYRLKIEGRRLFVFADYENDRFDGFDYQTSLAAGWTQQLWKEEKSAFSFSFGPGYSITPRENPEDDLSERTMILRGAMEYRYEFSPTASFRQFISSEADSDGSKSRAESELTAKIFDYLAMKLSFVMRHNDAVASDIRKLDTETALTLVYQFF